MTIEYFQALDGYSWHTDIRFQDASSPLTDAGSQSMSWTVIGTPIYRDTTFSDIWSDDSTYTTYDALTNGSNEGWYSTDVSWLTGKTTGSFVFSISRFNTSDTVFCFNGLAGGITSNVMRVWINATEEITVQIYGSGGAGTDEITQVWDNRGALTGDEPSIFVMTQDGTGIKLYCNGILLDLKSETVSTGDEGLWLSDIASGVDGVSLSGYVVWTSGPAFSSLSGDMDTNWQTFGYTDTVLTGAQQQDLWMSRFGDRVKGVANTTSGRNKFRKYWTNQDRGLAESDGIAGAAWVFNSMLGTAHRSHAQLWNSGDGGVGRWVSCTSENYFTELYPEANYGEDNWTYNLQGVSLNPAGNVICGGGSGFSGWEPAIKYYWKDYGWHEATADSLQGVGETLTPSIRGGTWHPDGDLWAGQGNRNSDGATAADQPFLYKWDGAGNFEDVRSRMDNTGTRASSDFHVVHFSPDGNWLVTGSASSSPYNSVSTSPVNLWKITTTTTDKDTFTWRTPYTSADLAFNTCYSTHFVTNSDGDLFLMCGQYAPTSGTVCVVTYKYTPGSDTWSKDLTIFNNGSNPTGFNTNTTGASHILSVGDDLYIGHRQGNSVTPYQNIWHLRWNGSYYAEQTNPTWPYSTLGTPVQKALHGFDITSDGKTVLVTTANPSPETIPYILAYDRDTTSGALTLRSSPYDFLAEADGGLVYDYSRGSAMRQATGGTVQVFDSLPTDAF